MQMKNMIVPFLQSIAHSAMLERGLLPDFSAAALAQLDTIPNSGR